MGYRYTDEITLAELIFFIDNYHMAKSKTVQAAVSKKTLDAPPEEKLNWKQSRFVEAYVESGNATQAYLKVYDCTLESADTHGPRLVGNGRVKAAIEKRRQYLLEVANYSMAKHVQVLVGVYTARRSDFCEVAKDVNDKENYADLGDKEYAIHKTKETTGEFGTKYEFELESKAWAERGLQTIFGFKIKPNQGNGGAVDKSVCEDARKLRESGKK
jgi:hypothetical protein